MYDTDRTDDADRTGTMVEHGVCAFKVRAVRQLGENYYVVVESNSNYIPNSNQQHMTSSTLGIILGSQQ